MAIEKKLVCFKTQANFDAQLSAGNIKDYSIVFIKDTQRIWTHGVYFTSLKELFEKLDTKQDTLTASTNITITESDGKVLISAKDTTYTLSLVGDLLTLKDSSDTAVSTIDLTKYVYTLPQATSEALGGVKIVDTVGEEGVKTDDITLQTIPSNGKKGQLLTHDGTKATWVYYNMLDMVSYGVKWKPDVADPHLERCGNLNMHKILPIQSAMKGCVYNPLTKTVIYWLDESNWNFRKNPTLLQNIDLSTDNTIIPVTDTTALVVGQYIRVHESEDMAVITEITENTSITVAWQGEAAPAETVDIEIGSRLDGYDGEVMVFVPEFWIKSWDETDNREVRISALAVDESWTHQPSVFLAAYHDTVLNTVPENMGYLSTLEANTAVSVANTNSYCRGGNNRTDYDTYLDTDVFRTDLGKPKVSMSRMTFRNYARKAGKENLSYRQYKNILYWLWVIEYANFNSQDTYTSELTAEGYHQGGMGPGMTSMSNWYEYNIYNPLTPNGYGNTLGNGTGVLDLVIPEFDWTVYSIWFNSMAANNNICTSTNSSNSSKLVTAVKGTDNYAFYHNPNSIWGTTTYVITGLTDGQTITFAEGSSYSTATEKLVVTEDGTYDIEWQDYNTGGQKWVSFGKIQESCNIVIYNSNRNTHIVTKSAQTLSMPRWRGIDNPFGDIWNNVDGIIVDADADNHPNNMDYVYTTDDPALYGDDRTAMEKMELTGLAIHQEGYTKEWDLGDSANIIPRVMGGNTTQYKCDCHWTGGKGTNLRCLLLGCDADRGAAAGLGSFNSHDGVGLAYSPVGFRSVVSVD